MTDNSQAADIIMRRLMENGLSMKIEIIDFTLIIWQHAVILLAGQQYQSEAACLISNADFDNRQRYEI